MCKIGHPQTIFRNVSGKRPETFPEKAESFKFQGLVFHPGKAYMLILPRMNYPVSWFVCPRFSAHECPPSLDPVPGRTNQLRTSKLFSCAKQLLKLLCLSICIASSLSAYRSLLIYHFVGQSISIFFFVSVSNFWSIFGKKIFGSYQCNLCNNSFAPSTCSHLGSMIFFYYFYRILKWSSAILGICTAEEHLVACTEKEHLGACTTKGHLSACTAKKHLYRKDHLDACIEIKHHKGACTWRKTSIHLHSKYRCL